MLKKRSFTLTEVLVSLSLILLTLPLMISVQTNISAQTQALARQIRLQQEVYTHFCTVLEELYENKIPLKGILEGGYEMNVADRAQFPNLSGSTLWIESGQNEEKRAYVLTLSYDRPDIRFYLAAEKERGKE